MGIFGSLIGWDQAMGAVNAVLASYLIEKAGWQERKRIAGEVVDIVRSVQRRDQQAVLKDLSERSRIVQMNFVALACDNLHIPPPVKNNVWTRVKNPFLIGSQVDERRISLAISAIEKQDGVRVNWPGDSKRINFEKMFEEGLLGYAGNLSGNATATPAAAAEKHTQALQSINKEATRQPEEPREAVSVFKEKPRLVLSGSQRETLNQFRSAGWMVSFNGTVWSLKKDGLTTELRSGEEIELFWKAVKNKN